MPTLAETQQLLWQLITAPEGVRAAVEADADRGGTAAAELARTVRGDGPLSAVQRVDVYANMYFFRVLDVLKETYPATLALLGEVPFHNLVTDYLLRHPPAHFSIREAGRHLPAWLAQHAVRQSHACAGDLARLERALIEAFDAADAEIATGAALAAIPPHRWPALRFGLHPSVRLLTCGWPVQEIRNAVDRGVPFDDPAPQPTRLCIWRRDLTVFHRALSAGEFAALEAVARGDAFADVCAAASDGIEAGEAARKVAGALAGWLSDGWFAGVRQGD